MDKSFLTAYESRRIIINFLIFFGVVTIIGIGCGEKNQKADKNKEMFSFRNISENELLNFIDNDYAISSNDIRITKNTLPYYANIDSDSYDEIILILEHEKPVEGKDAKVKILDFIESENKWDSITTIDLGKERVGNSFLITDHTTRHFEKLIHIHLW